jgi:hypothetical protein
MSGPAAVRAQNNPYQMETRCDTSYISCALLMLGASAALFATAFLKTDVNFKGHIVGGVILALPGLCCCKSSVHRQTTAASLFVTDEVIRIWTATYDEMLADNHMGPVHDVIRGGNFPLYGGLITRPALGLRAMAVQHNQLLTQLAANSGHIGAAAQLQKYHAMVALHPGNAIGGNRTEYMAMTISQFHSTIADAYKVAKEKNDFQPLIGALHPTGGLPCVEDRTERMTAFIARHNGQFISEHSLEKDRRDVVLGKMAAAYREAQQHAGHEATSNEVRAHLAQRVKLGTGEVLEAADGAFTQRDIDQLILAAQDKNEGLADLAALCPPREPLRQFLIKRTYARSDRPLNAMGDVYTLQDIDNYLHSVPRR